MFGSLLPLILELGNSPQNRKSSFSANADHVIINGTLNKTS
jgi:hypothetical protein